MKILQITLLFSFFSLSLFAQKEETKNGIELYNHVKKLMMTEFGFNYDSALQAKKDFVLNENTKNPLPFISSDPVVIITGHREVSLKELRYWRHPVSFYRISTGKFKKPRVNPKIIRDAVFISMVIR